MELKYIILTIIKILISVPSNFYVHGAALMGGYMDNSNNTHEFINIKIGSDGKFQREDIANDRSQEENYDDSSSSANNSEGIPDPSPLVIPGYNLPENIFNKGKPFYMEKDPVTGKIDFTNKTLPQIDDDFYDYTEEDTKQSDDIYNKANIDRKDGSLGSHRPSDINQLSPNFHDFLNLPIKYNPDKYVYPLISSGYANTKVQGNVNKFHNHKTHNEKYPTYKPSYSYSSGSNSYNNFEYEDKTTSTTTNAPLTTKELKSSTFKPISYPSFSEDFSDDYYGSSEKMKDDYDFQHKEIYKTTSEISNVFLTTSTLPPATTTRKIMSLFDQLFGEYDETVSTTQKTKPPSLFANLPSNKIAITLPPKEYSTSTIQSTSRPTSVNVASGSNMEMENLYEEYDDYYYNNPKSSEISSSSTLAFTTSSTTPSTTTTTTTTTTRAPPSTSRITIKPSAIYNSHSYMDSFSPIIPSTTKKVEDRTDPSPSSLITSLPLGDNHVTTPKIASWSNLQQTSEASDYHPIIIATQNLRDQLNNERVVPKPFSVHTQYAPSSSSIHIAPDQDTVSFVVGHHQKTDGSSYSTIHSQDDYSSNYFQPLYGEGSYEKDDIIYKNSPDSVIFQQPQIKPHHEVSGSVVTIQTQTNSEASLSIGVPVENIKKIPGKVIDAKLDLDNKEPVLSPSGSKVVFPSQKEVSLTSVLPPLSTSNPPVAMPNREILKLASKPMYHQLPSDLTPPKEKEGSNPSRIEAPRPPWDPRPGHFFSGNLEYSRPPRPFPDVAFKRIDTLPNILPQFRPNIPAHGPVNGNHHTHGSPHGHHRGPLNFYDNRLHREPLLERPSNRPLEFYEKLQPPPLPSKNLHSYRKIPPLPQVPQHLEQRTPMAQDRKGEDYVRKPPMISKIVLEPPKVISNLRKEDGAVETLQMLQAKQSEKKELYQEPANSIVQETNKTDKPVYVVYPVNTPPIKLDVIDSNKRESVVIGTRAELPLPPSEINKDFVQDKDPIIGVIDRNDAPVLKPQLRPPVFPMKSDFPYPLERPDISVLHPVPDASNNRIGSEDISHPEIEGTFLSNNQWNSLDSNVESRIVTGSKVHNHIYAEKPIAVAYTPTEPSQPNIPNDFFNPSSESPNPNVYLVSANKEIGNNHKIETRPHSLSNHRTEENVSDNMNVRTEQDFQAPFQASVKVDSPSQGWSVIRRSDTKTKISEEAETTTVVPATTSEFDIENFKPQLEGGFRPIYTFRSEDANTKVDERQE